MRKIILQKEEEIKKFGEKIQNSTGLVIFKYLGLDAQDFTILRKEMLANDARVFILKNNIISRSLRHASIEEFGDLVGPNAIIISNGDPIAPLRSIKKLMKLNTFINFRGSVVEKVYSNEQQTLQLSSLPSREGMYSMVLSCLTSPLRSLMFALKAVGEAKEN